MKKALALLLIALLAFSACSALAEAVEYKDTLIVGTYGDQDTLDPQVNVTNDKVLRLLYEGLLTHDENSNIIPCLAESWGHSDDYLTWTFHLRQDVKFANGKDLTSKDVVATFNRLIDKDHPLRYSEKVEFIDSVEALDDYTVQINCGYVYAIVEETLALQCCFILDADYIEQYGYDIGIDLDTINGTGPYKITKWDAEEQMVFEANEYWWAGEVGTPNMIYKVIPEAASRALAIETGEVDVLDRPAVGDYQRLANTPGLVGISQPGYGLQGFQFNCSELSVCQDVNVRKAISMAIDRETIVQALYGEIGEVPTHGPMVPATFAYVDLGVPTYDPVAAKELLAEAGYPDGFDLNMMTFDGYNKAVEMAEIVKEQLGEIGINVTIDSVDNATFNSIFGITKEEMKYDMFIMGFGGSGTDPDGSLRRVMKTAEDELNTNNYGWYSNARVDELLEAGVVEMDPEKRKEMYAEIQKIVYLDDPFAIYMNLRSSLYIIKDTVENFNINCMQVVEFEKIKVRA